MKHILLHGEKNRKKLIFFCLLLLLIGYAAFDRYIPKSNTIRSFGKADNFQHSFSFIDEWRELVNRKWDYARFENDCDFTWRKSAAIPWFQLQNRTDPKRGYLLRWNINPAEEFSSIVLQTQYSNSSIKYRGGDHWRAQIKGPSSIYVSKTDFRNGSYEFKFLPVVPGTYQLFIWLEYTLCAGLKDPPSDWFIIGTAQGKEQKQGSLYRDLPFINKPLWSATQITFIVPETNAKGSNINQACTTVKPSCNLLWNGHGSWVNKTQWFPLCPTSTELRYPRDMRNPVRGVLWILGDSVSTQFYHRIKTNMICKSLFVRCMYTYNWMYNVENYNATLKRYVRRDTDHEKITWSDEDFNVDRIVDELRQVLLHPAMATNESVLLLNYGLHCAESLNYTNFKNVIHKTIELLEKEARCQVIWRTTTSLNRHRYSKPNGHARRFFTSPRVELYNAYATKKFCEHQFGVLDIFPLTDSYPNGTGPKTTSTDPVHYQYRVMKPMEELLERVFAFDEPKDYVY